jgi:EAL domain-containing protein (putative c-di-GMP-specific phosphodiesterase class I)
MMAADAACYAAKDAGRNRVHVYQPEDEVLSRRSGEMQWVARIGRALEEGRLALCAQPIAPTRGAAVHDPHRDPAHFEVLLRMRGEDDALILPNAFLPAAERYNLATRLDLWVLDATLSWLLALPGRLARVQTCCLNLSGHSIGDEGFLQHLLEALHRHQELGPRLCFELTETAAVANLERSIRFMEQLRRLGCRFALDDFGTGLSSFGYLKSLPVDYLKIDGVFVRGMLDDPIDRAMVTSIHEVSRITGKKTIAENVESPRALALLEDLGVDFAQGHLIGMPVPLEDAVRPRKAQVVPIHS